MEEGRKKGNASDLPVGIPQWKEEKDDEDDKNNG